MDEETARRHAQEHADAVVAGDLRRAASDLDETARGQATEVMGRLPQPLIGAEVLEVRPSSTTALALIRYRGEEEEATVVSRWEERDGRPAIVSLEVL